MILIILLILVAILNTSDSLCKKDYSVFKIVNFWTFPVVFIIWYILLVYFDIQVMYIWIIFIIEKVLYYKYYHK